MKNILQQYRQHLPVFVLLSLLSGMGLIAWFGIVPFHGFITEKADGIQEYYAFRENRGRQIGKLPELEREWETITENEQALDILLSEGEIVDFVKTLEGLAEREDVSITIESKTGEGIVEKAPGQPAPAGGAKNSSLSMLDTLPYHRYLHVSVVVIGEYRNIVAFLHGMETLPLALDVIGFEVRERNEDEIGSRPSTPDAGKRNPFLMFDQGPTSIGNAETAPEEEVIRGSLEASFDTIVYVSK